MKRPRPLSDAPPGFHYEVSNRAYHDWTVLEGDHGRRCRMMGSGHHVCRRPAVAVLWRPQGAGKAAWPYCELHLYGRWIEDGQVVAWRLVRDEGSS